MVRCGQARPGRCAPKPVDPSAAWPLFTPPIWWSRWTVHECNERPRQLRCSEAECRAVCAGQASRRGLSCVIRRSSGGGSPT
jgi:hypothetical protein